MRCVDDEHVGPLGQSLKHLLRVRRFQIERNPTLVSIRQLKGVSLFRMRLRRDLLSDSPHLSLRRLDFDDIGAEIGQDGCSGRPCNEARQVYDLQSGKNIAF